MKSDAELHSQKQLKESNRTVLPAKEDRSLGKQEMARESAAKEENTCIFASFLLLSTRRFFK